MTQPQPDTTPEPRTRVLVVDDDTKVRNTLARLLAHVGCEAVQASGGSAALERIESEHFDAALVDIKMPGIDGLEVTRRAKRLCPDLYIVLVTAFATIELAVDALQHGADDFLPKPLRIDQLRVILDKQRETRRDAPRAALATDGTDALPGLVGTSPAIRAVYRAIRRVAPSHETVLILGESGTGKELAARAIHFWSRRHSKPFVCVNCASIAEGVLENELFGHEPESFTGANGRKKGLVEEASGGTLFLDEVGDARPSLQMSLLRFLQQGEVRRIGSAESIPVDVRVVAASNKNLEREIGTARFRKDLFYRLSVVPIEMPPLRDRPGDIPLLVDHFLRLFRATDRSFADDAVRALQRCPWPGNVRELENVVRRLLVLVPDSAITLAHLPSHYREAPVPRGLSAGSFREAKEIFERQYIETLLQRVGGNVAEAARQAGLGRPYFHEKIRKFGIDPDLFRHQSPPIA